MLFIVFLIKNLIKPYITSTKGVTGHSLAASGALEAVFSVLKIHKCEIPPVAGLKNIDEKILMKK
ncbi:hypothetical protein ACK85T_003733 [Salmonella enterica]